MPYALHSRAAQAVHEPDEEGEDDDAAAEAPEGVETGNGNMDQAGNCRCAVQCANGNFPAMEAQGVGMFGGYGGKFYS